jgi:tetratricopeptide (TPR) repeat protein
MGILQTAQVATIVEIGSEHGEFTEVLCAHAQSLGGRLISIDPAPQAAALDFIQTHHRQSYFQFLQKTSHEALPGLRADAYIVDGDHNYYTVLRELELIEAGFGASPFLAIMHDVCWPCGRRDAYYNPAAIPAEHRRAHSDKGAIAPGIAGLAESGLLLTSVMPFAVEEGGPANGVRTAAEDFLAARSRLEFVTIPAMLGLGILYDRTAPWAEALSKLLAPFASNPLLERLEANRLQLFLRVLDLEKKLAALSASHAAQGLIKQPVTPQAQRALAEAYLAERQWVEAGALFQSLVHHFPDDLKLWQGNLECAQRLNHRTHAKLIFNDAVRLHPEWSTALQSETAPKSN